MERVYILQQTKQKCIGVLKQSAVSKRVTLRLSIQYNEAVNVKFNNVDTFDYDK